MPLRSGVRIQVLLPSEAANAVQLLSEAEGKSMSKICGELVLESLLTKKDRLTEAARKLSQRSALEHLGLNEPSSL